MNNTQLKATLETRLGTATSKTIIYENTGQTPPATMYVESVLRPVIEDRNTVNSQGNYIISRGNYYVYVVDPTISGTGAASGEVDTICSYFKATTLDIGHGGVHVDVPIISFLGRLDKGYTVAIRVPYWYYHG